MKDGDRVVKLLQQQNNVPPQKTLTRQEINQRVNQLLS